MCVVSGAPTINYLYSRLGPLSIEQKKRKFTQRAKLEKDKADMRKPQEIKEEDIARAENETTKNVATVSAVQISQSYSSLISLA